MKISLWKKNITIDDLAPAPCPKWMEGDHYGGNSKTWKLDFHLKKKLFEQHIDVAENLFWVDIEPNDILNAVSERTKIIYGIVGSNAADIWHSEAYRAAHHGTVRLMKIWGLTLEAENKPCRYCS